VVKWNLVGRDRKVTLRAGGENNRPGHCGDRLDDTGIWERDEMGSVLKGEGWGVVGE
jgi:hypothetical protein